MENSVGKMLKQLRLARNLTQAQVGERVGISRKEVSQYETGTRQPTSDIVVSLANAFHVTTDYLLGLQNNQVIDASGLTSRECQILSELVNEMSEKNQELQIRRD